jgi:hypothetical protein
MPWLEPSDQHARARKLGIETVTQRLTFDNAHHHRIPPVRPSAARWLMSVTADDSTNAT